MSSTMSSTIYQQKTDIEAATIVQQLKTFAEENGIVFYRIEEDFQGINKYVRFSVSMKIKDDGYGQ